jgi:quercetin 2,3-dioxygenase
VAQLWVNLPAAHKLDPPRYQEIPGARIPTVTLPDGATVRVIAGECRGVKGAAQTFTPLDVWDLRIPAGRRAELELPPGHNTLLAVLRGDVTLEGGEMLSGPQLARLARDGDSVALEARTDAGLLVLAGRPLDEPIVSYGPFVMNTEAEIRQAIEDYRSGRMGHLAA